ncbi:MAG: hypothetical protein CL960_03815 [Euryarchaeota archaeon]|nr:hypothetical protein [Euryarchaeota archaeon]
MESSEAPCTALPCAGTHVRSTAEIGEVEFIKRDNKGSGKQRLTYTLKKPGSE